jgi:hypothetical protein
MAQFETTGGGYIDSGDRRVIRKVLVSTDGQLINVPQTEQGFPLSNVSVSEDAGGVRRAVVEYSRGGDGGASYNIYGKRIELTGGTIEAPIQTHKRFKDMTEDELFEVGEAVENKNYSWVPTADQQLLYDFLRRKKEYVLFPSVVGRISEVESALPSLDPIAKVANPTELNAPAETFWICTAITASPIGDRYEVTREYTLNFDAWSNIKEIYNW